MLFFSLSACLFYLILPGDKVYEIHAGLELMNHLHQALDYGEHRLGDCLALDSFCQWVISSCDELNMVSLPLFRAVT